LALLACGEAPPPEPPPVDDDTVAPWELQGIHGATDEIDVAVQRVDWVRREDASLEAHLDVVLRLVRRPEWDGLRAWHRRVIVETRNVQLVVDGEPVEPIQLSRGPGFFGERMDVPADGDRQVRGTLVVPTGSDEPPTTMSLRMKLRTGTLVVPIRTDGARSVQVVDGYGRALRDVAVSQGDTPLSRPDPFEPWSVTGAPVTATVDGQVLTEDPEGWVVVPAPGPEPALSASVPSEVWQPRTLSAAANALTTEADVEAFVSSLAVLPTTGLQRGVLTVLERGGGSPIERAQVGVELLQRLGIDARVACGDLPPLQVGRVYTGSIAPLADDDLLAPLVAEARSDLERLVPALRTSFDTLDREPSVRERIPLVPEWCWLQVREGDQARDIDLRPLDVRDFEVPGAWRVVEDVRADLWRLSLRVWARTLEGDPEKGEYGGKNLVDYETNSLVLSDRGLVFDLYPDRLADGPTQLRSQLLVAGVDAAGGRIGGNVDRDTLDAVGVSLAWIDPRGLTSATQDFTVWSRDRDARLPDRLRVVLGGDTGSVDGSLARRHAVDAYRGGSVAPSVSATLARHALFSGLRRRLAGVERAQPSVLATVLSRLQDGEVRMRFVDLQPSGPAYLPGADVADATVRLAAADAVARHVLVGFDGPEALEAPASWVATDGRMLDGLLKLGRLDQWQLRHLRAAEKWASAVGVGGEKTRLTFWSWAEDSGALTPLGLSRHTAAWPAAAEDPADEGLNDPLSVQRHWLRPLLCRDSARWAAMLGRPDVPAAEICTLPE
jgi:hypothetical protein